METKGNSDLNSTIIICLIPMVILTGWFFTLTGNIDQNFAAIKMYYENKGGLFGFYFLLNLIITISICWIFVIYFGIGKFGRKIKQFRQTKIDNYSKVEKLYFLIISFGFGVLFLFLGKNFWSYEILKPFPIVVPKVQSDLLFSYFRINLFFFGISFGFLLCHTFKFFRKILRGNIPPLPERKNALILGSKMLDGNEEWISIGRSGLVTGVMLVASTGGGKSVACLLPWTKQFMTNFSPFPSIVVIDPKDSFGKSVIKMAGELGHEERVVHFTLDGRFKTNPIYRPNILKESGFMYVTSLIRAATINFMGTEEGDQKFWGTKGATLIRNLIIYCAAKYDGYFTLKEFYQEMIEIPERDFATEIEVYVENEKYDWDEKRNLEISRDYFQFEFSNLDSKIKDSIAQTATSFLGQIREARIEQVFCPSREEINFWGFDEIVDEGKIFVFGIDVPGLSGPISVLMKLMYQNSVMERIKNRKRLETGRLSIGIYDEYQTFVSLGGGQIEGDDDYAAKRREALGVTIVATQSHSSLLQATGNDVGTDVLLTNFRTRIVGATTDKRTIDHYKEIGGEIQEEIESESYTESGLKPTKQLLGKGLMTSQPTVSQSVNKNQQKRPRITGEVMSRLRTFEAIGLVFDGVETEFYDKICLKPAFLPTMRTPHHKVIEIAKAAAMACFLLFTIRTNAFPSVCSAVKTPAFESCMEHVKSSCSCGWPPRPCSLHTYYIPTTFIEVTSRPKQSFFSDLPIASIQLKNLKEAWFSSGSVEMDSRFYHARVIAAPFVNMAYSGMPCGTGETERYCFGAMSEQISKQWKTGAADVNDPQFKLWSLKPNACLIKGAVSAGATGQVQKGSPTGGASCGYPLPNLSTFPPVTTDICGGWGVLLPRTGFVESNSSVGGALLAAERIRSIANEVYRSVAVHPDEKWQMIFPKSSNCFREGQSVGKLETIDGVNEIGRIAKLNHDSWLFVVWKRVACCKDVNSIPQAEFGKSVMKSMCQGLE